MSTATKKAGDAVGDSKPGGLDAAEFAADFPDDEVFVYRNHTLRSPGFPLGVECLITIPKAKIGGHWLAERARRNERVIDVTEAGPRGVTPITERG